jgi:hypothetical protein
MLGRPRKIPSYCLDRASDHAVVKYGHPASDPKVREAVGVGSPKVVYQVTLSTTFDLK